MAVTVLKKKKKKEEQEQVAVEVKSDLERLADEYAEAALRVEELSKPKPELVEAKKRLEAVKADLLKKADEVLPPDGAITITGKHVVKVGAKAKVRRITDMNKVKKFLGVETFMKLVTITFSNLDKYLTPSQLEKVVEAEHKGKRSLKVES